MFSRFLISLIFLFWGSVEFGQAQVPIPIPNLPTSKSIRLPEIPADNVPKPSPVNLIQDGATYVIDSDVKLIIKTSPANLVTVTSDTGPIKIRGLFADSSKKETRTYKGCFVYSIEATEGASGNIELLIIPVGLQSDSDIITRTLSLGKNPNPPVPPVPTATNLFIVVVEDIAKRTLDTANIVNNTTFWTNLKTNGDDYRFYDINTTDPIGVSYASYAKNKTLPTIIFADRTTGKVLGAESLPPTTDAITKLEAKYKGTK